MEEYLSIQEFAQLAGVTPQSIYKRIRKSNNQIHSFLKKDEEGLKLHKSALSILYGISEEETTNKPSLKVDKPKEEEKQQKQEKIKETQIKETADQKVIEILREQIEILRKDNEGKDKQIAELHERLAESQKMIDQQQKLSMADKQQILLLEEQTRTNKEKSRGLFGWFKGLKNK